MKIYTVSYAYDNGWNGVGLAYFGSKQEAEAWAARRRKLDRECIKEQQADDDNGEVNNYIQDDFAAHVMAIEIPTDKDGLIDWLRAYHSHTQ
jgi:hypothetical protein